MCFPIPLKKTQLATELTLLECGEQKIFVEGTAILLPKRSLEDFLSYRETFFFILSINISKLLQIVTIRQKYHLKVELGILCGSLWAM